MKYFKLALTAVVALLATAVQPVVAATIQAPTAIASFAKSCAESLFLAVQGFMASQGLMLNALPMRSTDFRAIVEPIMNTVFDGLYDQRDDEFKSFMSVETGTQRAYHEEVMMYGFNAAPELPDGMPVTYRQGGILYTKRYEYKVYGLAFALTKVLVEDGDHIRIGATFSKHLAQALMETQETIGANILNFGFNGAYPGGDGVALFSGAHPTANGSFSNILTTPAALSQTSVEQMLIQIRNAVDNNGKRSRLMAKKLLVSPQNMMQAEVILKSVLRTGTANNDINPVKSMGLLDPNPIIVSRMTSPTAWGITTDNKNGLKMLMRRNLERSMEGDFETDSMRYKATMRYVAGWTDPRALYFTQGA